MTAEGRIASLHRRMEVQSRRQEKQKMTAMGAASFALTACLLALFADRGMNHRSATATQYAGATMLFDNAGGYVLAAILAFMAGVVITVVCLRRNKNGK